MQSVVSKKGSQPETHTSEKKLSQEKNGQGQLTGQDYSDEVWGARAQISRLPPPLPPSLSTSDLIIVLLCSMIH